MLRLVQINMQRSRTATCEVAGRLLSGEADVVLAQEPYNDRGKLHGIGMRNTVITGCQRGETAQAAIVIRGGAYTVLKMTHLSGTHVTCVQITGGFGSLYLVSQYFQYSDDLETGLQELGRILDELRGQRVVVGADVNAVSPLWDFRASKGSRRATRRGDRIEEFIASRGLVVINRPGNLETFSSSMGQSNIDVTLATPNACAMVRTWRVRDGWVTSDHRAIEVKLGPAPGNEPGPERTGRFVTSRAKWELFDAELNERKAALRRTDIDSAEDVEIAAERMERAILSACDSSMPTKKWHARALPGWTPELTDRKKAVYRSRRAFQAERDADERAAKRATYLRLARGYRRAVTAARVNSWKDFVSKAGNTEPWGIAYRVALDRVHLETAMSSIRLPQGQYTQDWEGSARTLLHALAPDDEDTNETDEQRRTREEAVETRATCDESDFTRGDLRRAVKHLKNRKSPGLDRVEVEVLKRAEDTVGKELLRLYNGCLRYGVFPTRWKIGSVRALLKAKDKDETNPKSYRPICLLSVMGKVLEKMMARRLSRIFHHHERSSDRQYGFKPGRGTDDALMAFRTLVTESGGEGYALALSFDIAGAFDNVWWPSILAELSRRECPRNMFALIASYFAGRETRIVSRHAEVSKIATKGCPQGSILGPNFWNLVFDGILRELVTDGDCEPIAYADDLLAIVSGKSRRELEQRAQRVATRIAGWCSERKLSLSAEKTTMMMVRGGLCASRPPTVQIGGCGITLQTTMKYLGVTFGAGMSVAPHARSTAAKAREMFGKLAGLAKAKWGLSHGTMEVLYKGLFVPAVTYGAVGWVDLATRKDWKALLAAQRQALLRVTRAYRTTSTEAMCVVAGQPPIDLLCQERAYRHKVRRGDGFTHGQCVHRPEDHRGDRDYGRQTNRELRAETLRRWQARWDAALTGRTTRRFFEDVGQRVEAGWMRVDYYVTQFLTGHGDFQGKLHSFGLVETGECECGHPTETSEHVLHDCFRYSTERATLEAAAERMDRGHPLRERTLVEREIFPAFKQYAYDVLQRKEEERRALARRSA